MTPAHPLYDVLRRTFKDPIVVLVTGEWRQGKTDTSLLCVHLAKKWGIIDKIGANIWTFNDPEVEYIISLGKLKRWLHADKSIKVFLFDEGLVHVYRRTAMSVKNISVIQILGELSKGHGRMLFLSQTTKLDSDILHPAFCRSHWEKLNKKTMRCLSKHHAPRTFRNLPKSPIRFDPDRLAPFIDTELSKESYSGERGVTYQIAKLYHGGKSMTAIEKEDGFHREEVRRHIKKALHWFITNFDELGTSTEKPLSETDN